MYFEFHMNDLIVKMESAFKCMNLEKQNYLVFMVFLM